MAELVAPPPEKAPPPHKKSAGEVVFDRTVYTGIGFGVNEISSLWITNQFALGKNLFAKVPGLQTFGRWFSKEGYDHASEWLGKALKFSEKIAKDGSKITPKAQGSNALLMTTLISGGTLLILPMKLIENHKAYWVQKANHMVDWMRGSKMSQEEINERDGKVAIDIACEPKQSWPSMLLGRTIAVASSISLGTFIVGKKNNDKLQDWSEKLIMGDVLRNPPANAPAHSLRNYARLLSVETYSCATSSIVLEVMSKLFAKRSSTPQNLEICSKKTDDDVPVLEKMPENLKKTVSYCEKIKAQKNQANFENVAMQM